MLRARKIAKRPPVRKKKASGVWGTATYSNFFSLKALKFLGIAGFAAGIFWVVITAVIAAQY